MDLESSGLSLEEKLIHSIDKNDANKVEQLLKEGKSASQEGGSFVMKHPFANRIVVNRKYANNEAQRLLL